MNGVKLLAEEASKHIDPEGLFVTAYKTGESLEVFFEKGKELQAFISFITEYAKSLPGSWALASLSEDSGCIVYVWDEDDQDMLSWAKLL